MEKAREFQKKTSLSASLIMLKSFIFYFFQTLFFFTFIFYFIFKLYTIVLVLPNIEMTPPHKGGVICISEVIDISPGNLDSSLCFFQSSVSHDVLCI